MLPVAPSWFRKTVRSETLTQIDEPHAHLMVAANIWHMRGAERDLVFDTGLGVGSLRTHCPELFARDPLVVVSHAHLDHVGGAHEFAGCTVARAEDFTQVLGTLSGPELSRGLRLSDADWEPDGVPELLIDALPDASYDPASYRVEPPRITAHVDDGDVLDIGGHRFTALVLPGHTPGSLALFEEASGTLLSGDVIYDDVLLDTTEGADASVYATSLRRLAALPIATVHPGHGESFGGERMRAIIGHYLGGE